MAVVQNGCRWHRNRNIRCGHHRAAGVAIQEIQEEDTFHLDISYYFHVYVIQPQAAREGRKGHFYFRFGGAFLHPLFINPRFSSISITITPYL